MKGKLFIMAVGVMLALDESSFGTHILSTWLFKLNSYQVTVVPFWTLGVLVFFVGLALAVRETKR